MDMKLYLQILANASGLKREMGESKSAVSRFAQGAKHELDALKGSVGTVQGKLASLGLTIGVVQQLSASARLDKGLTQLKQTAGEGTGAIRGLRRELFLMNHETGRSVDNLKDGMDSLIQSGQSWKAALESTKGINIASAVTGANEKTLAGGLTVGATAFNLDLEKPGKALELLDKMTVAGRLGNAELENLSDIFARVGVNAASAGMGFEKTLAFIESLSMVERQPERLATMADSTLRLFTNLRYLAEAQKGTGVKFFATDGSRRDPIAVLKEMKVKWDALKTDKARAVFIQKALPHADLDTVKGMRTLLSGDSLSKIDQFTRQIGTAGGTLKRDLPDAIANAVDQSGRLKGALREAADSFAQPINKAVADFIQFGLDKKKNGGLELSGKELLGYGAGGTLATMALARYGSKGVGALAGRLLAKGGSTAIGVAEGKALEAAAGITPVFVTNWPGGPVPGLPVPAGGGGAAGGAAGRAAGAGAAAAGRLRALWQLASNPAATGSAAVLSRLGLVGLSAGAGYLVGSGVNGALDYTARQVSGGTANTLGERLFDVFHSSTSSTSSTSSASSASSTLSTSSTSSKWAALDRAPIEPQTLSSAVRPAAGQKNAITINMRVDRDGRVFVDSNDMNTKAELNVDRGDFGAALLGVNY